VGGNIGVPVLDLLQGEEPQLFVLELSSFQLETTQSLNPVAATILNISADHMDRYPDLQAYAAAKAHIFNGSGALIVNADEPLVVELAAGWSGRRVVTFRLGVPSPQGFGVLNRDGEPWLANDGDALLPISALRIHGDHNVSNALAALALGQAAGLPMPAMLTALRAFRGLPHRTEWVAEHDGVIWFNDSKATNVGATLAALHGIRAKHVVLIAGGQAKGQDFGPLREALRRRVRTLILFGQDADLMQHELGDAVKICRVDTLSAAVTRAAEEARAGDAVLLSPACASFDMFKGYADRGTQFTDTVRRRFA
jgi:UDP-N-acetylmuramoylalanine--D-glutamate ligase